jgi:hypothetical protein
VLNVTKSNVTKSKIEKINEIKPSRWPQFFWYSILLEYYGSSKL